MISKWLPGVILFLVAYFTARGQALPDYTVTVLDPRSSGYYFITPYVDKLLPQPSKIFNLILDNTGTIIYYKEFSGEKQVCDFKLLKNGLISFYWHNKFYLMNEKFDIIDSVLCSNGILPDNHELQLLPNDNFLILGRENISMDLSAYPYFNNRNSPGSKAATVRCGVIQELDKNKKVVFEWHAQKYFSFGDVDPYYLKDSCTIDWTHFNAIEQDLDGNYLLSVRHFNEITKISRKNGSIIWRLGGKKNQFKFLNDTGKFYGQHDIRRIANNTITLFDNGRRGGSHPSSAKEYNLDEKKHRAFLTWKYIDNPATTSSEGLGNVQNLDNGNILINYGRIEGSNILFNVTTRENSKIFEIRFQDTMRTYRAFNYPESSFKLTRPVITTERIDGKLYLIAENGHKEYRWKGGETDQKILVTKPGNYIVFVSLNDGGFLSSLPFSVTESEFLDKTSRQ
jgi:hypothetical protein